MDVSSGFSFPGMDMEAWTMDAMDVGVARGVAASRGAHAPWRFLEASTSSKNCSGVVRSLTFSASALFALPGLL